MIRIVNWIKWKLNGNLLESRWVHSLEIQVRYLFKNIERITKEYFYSNNKLTSTENIWDGFGHYQLSFKKNWMTLIYNYSYTWHQELLAKKND